MTTADGPTLYLEPDTLDESETFCTAVFDEDDRGEYRVVQLTAARSFDSLRDSLSGHLETVNDPSEAAVIITTPTPGDDATVTDVGPDTALFGFRVEPEDLTGISIAFSELLERWETHDTPVRVCLRDIESLLPYHETDLVYRFLNTILATLQGAGANVHAHLDPSSVDPRAVELFGSLFAEVLDAEVSTVDPQVAADAAASDPPDAASEGEAAAEAVDEAPGDGATAGDDGVEAAGKSDLHSVEMDRAAIDDFLAATGYGVLAFAGDPPYAIPMSYGYDPDTGHCYLQLSDFDGSEKQVRLESSPSVSLVVTQYDRPDRWRSVVVEGRLAPLSTTDLDERDVLPTYANSRLASVDVFDRDPDEVAFGWYVLEPDAVTGRQSGGRTAE
jgi:nitroimidazol reductase NimA-like FMN-containing flavoprotein (pyridoxamine 5'-phosphate oxidase superfamily)